MNPMSYENEEYILQFFEGVHEEENRAELVEVYQKANAYEKIRQVFRNNPGVKDEEKLWNIYYNSFKVFEELESGERNEYQQ